MKKWTRLSLILVGILVMVTCLVLAACAEPVEKFAVTYEANEGGTISGEVEQLVELGQNASTVVAVPNTGFRFIKWSDNDSAVATRTDTNVIGNIFAVAFFEEQIRTFTYNYNNATDFYAEENNTIDKVTISHEDLAEDMTLVIPLREHFTFDGWYLDKEYTTQVTNEHGAVVIDDTLFDFNSNELIAKWTVIEEVHYKILMVFVTEIKGNFLTKDGDEIIKVEYSMPEIERTICEMIVEQFPKHLNEMFNGLVIFDVDSYFTTVPISEKEFSRSSVYTSKAYRIPEIKPMLGDYRSIFTTYNLNDYLYDYKIKGSGASAGEKYAQCNLDSFFLNFRWNNVPIEELLDVNYEMHKGQLYWHSILKDYLHEFTHTAEAWFVDIYEFHEALDRSNNNSIARHLEICELYLLNKVFIDGERIGIPYHFWRDDVYVDPYLDWLDRVIN